MDRTTFLEKVWQIVWSITAVGCALGVATSEELLFVSEANHVR
jgi:hypothetical protein